MATAASGTGGHRSVHEFTVSAVFGWSAPMGSRAYPGLFSLNAASGRARRVVVTSRSVTSSTSKKAALTFPHAPD